MRSCRLIQLLAVLVAGSVYLGLAADEDVRVPLPVTADFLAKIREVPFYFEHDPGDPKFLAIVKMGLPVVPDLIDNLENPTYTELRVPLTGGQYALGDIAMEAISDIIRDVPWLTFITTADDPEIREIGFGVYWKFVRASPRNRQVLKTRAKAWYEQHRTNLVWLADPDLPSGGMWVLADKKKGRDG